jgi:hypothetical protein
MKYAKKGEIIMVKKSVYGGKSIRPSKQVVKRKLAAKLSTPVSAPAAISPAERPPVIASYALNSNPILKAPGPLSVGQRFALVADGKPAPIPDADAVEKAWMKSSARRGMMPYEQLAQEEEMDEFRAWKKAKAAPTKPASRSRTRRKKGSQQ